MREHPGTFVSGILFAFIGVVALLDPLDVWDLRPWWLWPVLLIAVGVAVIAGARTPEEGDEDS
jgi:hypothetical protein